MKETEQTIRKQVNDFVKDATTFGQLDLVYRDFPGNLRLLYLFSGNDDEHFFTEIVERSQISPAQLSSENPFELIVENGRTKVQDVIHALPAFIRFNYPFVEALPIRIYKPSHNFPKYRLSASIYLPDTKAA